MYTRFRLHESKWIWLLCPSENGTNAVFIFTCRILTSFDDLSKLRFTFWVSFTKKYTESFRSNVVSIFDLWRCNRLYPVKRISRFKPRSSLSLLNYFVSKAMPRRCKQIRINICSTSLFVCFLLGGRFYNSIFYFIQDTSNYFLHAGFYSHFLSSKQKNYFFV